MFLEQLKKRYLKTVCSFFVETKCFFFSIIFIENNLIIIRNNYIEKVLVS